jgi:hypothetical protein
MNKKDRKPQVQSIANPLNRPGKSLRPAVDLKEKKPPSNSPMVRLNSPTAGGRMVASNLGDWV